MFPRLLLLKQHDLDLDAAEVVVLLNLIASWWDEHDFPYPAVATIADRMGVTSRTVQRSLEKLAVKGFIRRVRNSPGNGRSSDLKVTRYDLTGTVQRIIQSDSIPTRKRAKPKPSEFNAGQRVPPNPEFLKVFDSGAT